MSNTRVVLDVVGNNEALKTPLAEAVACGDVERARSLFDVGIEDAGTIDGKPLIYYAIEQVSYEMALLLAERLPDIDFSYVDRQYETVISFAALRAHQHSKQFWNVVLRLLDRIYFITPQLSMQHGLVRAFDFAIQDQHLNVIKKLLAHNTSRPLRNAIVPALVDAIVRFDSRFCMLILHQFPNIDYGQRLIDGDTLLRKAIKYSQWQCFELLLRKSNWPQEDLEYALYRAVGNNDELVDDLLQRGAVGTYGENVTVLELAVSRNKPLICAKLVRAGRANPDASKFTEQAVSLAKARGFTECVLAITHPNLVLCDIAATILTLNMGLNQPGSDFGRLNHDVLLPILREALAVTYKFHGETFSDIKVLEQLDEHNYIHDVRRFVNAYDEPYGKQKAGEGDDALIAIRYILANPTFQRFTKKLALELVVKRLVKQAGQASRVYRLLKRYDLLPPVEPIATDVVHEDTTLQDELTTGVISGDIKAVNRLLNTSANFTKKDSNGQTVCDLAVDHGHWHIVILIARRRYDTRQQYGFARALYHAVEQGRERAVAALLKGCARPEAFMNHAGEYALHVAVRGGLLSIVEMLLNAGANPDQPNSAGQTASSIAYANKHFNCFYACVARSKQINSRLIYSNAFIQAVKHGEVGNVRQLLKVGIKPNSVVDADGNSALHLAVANNDVTIIKLLLTYHASLSQKDASNRTACDIAVANNYWDTVFILMNSRQHGNNDYGFNCALISATAQNDPIVTDMLLDRHVDPNAARDSNGNTALHIAAERGNLEIVDQLMQHHANLKLTNTAGKSPIELAAINDHWHVVAEFVMHIMRKNIYIQGINQVIGLTALQGKYNACLMLIKAGANLNVTIGVAENSILMLAGVSRNLKLFQLLLRKGADISYENSSKTTVAEIVSDWPEATAILNNIEQKLHAIKALIDEYQNNLPYQQIGLFKKLHGKVRSRWRSNASVELVQNIEDTLVSSQLTAYMKVEHIECLIREYIQANPNSESRAMTLLHKHDLAAPTVDRCQTSTCS